MADRVIIHVGAPKTGTSFVQDRLFRNPEALRRQGVLYPGHRHDAHFLAALDLMGLKWGGLEAEAVGHWAALAEQIRAHRGTAIISHEILGIATPEQIQRARADLGGARLDVVMSVRDLVRQIPAEWQENVKHRRELTYADFLARIQDPARDSVLGWWFWGVQDVPAVLERWGAGLPAEQVHVVTVPPPGAPKDLLWQRFCAVLGVDDTEFSAQGERANPSLGVPETALVRRLNVLLKPVLPNHHYRHLIREVLVHQNLSKRRGSARLALPPDAYEWAAGLSRGWAQEIAARGYDVVGDLDELNPSPIEAFADPDRPDETEVADAAMAGLTALALEGARLREEEDRLRQRIADLEGAIARIESAPDYRFKKRLVALLHTNPWGQAGLDRYRKRFGR